SPAFIELCPAVLGCRRLSAALCLPILGGDDGGKPRQATLESRTMARLKVSFVASVKNGGVKRGEVKPGRDRDGGGLILCIGKHGASWVLRYQLNGRRRDLGLGALERIGLSMARTLAARQRDALKAHRVDPIAQRREERAKAAKSIVTFDRVAAQYI